MTDEVLWTSATPLLETSRKPVILRFASDTFMDDFTALLQNEPERLMELRAQPETWQEPLPALDATKILPPALRAIQSRKQLVSGDVFAKPAAKTFPSLRVTTPLKLYQPGHMRFYLITASLVCRQAGLPDRALDSGADEKVSFVVRRKMLPAAEYEKYKDSPPGSIPTLSNKPEIYVEHALVNGAWQAIPAGEGGTLIPGEEQNPLFAMHYNQGDGYNRRLLGGLIPVGKREQYLGAAVGAAVRASVMAGNSGVGSGSGTVDPRLDMQLIRLFFAPWMQLVEATEIFVEKIREDRSDDNTATEQASSIGLKRNQLIEASWYLLLDMADFLEMHLPGVLAELKAGTAQSNAAKLLTEVTLAADVANELIHKLGLNPATSLGNALGRIQSFRQNLEDAEKEYPSANTLLWPDFVFPLVDTADDAGFPYLSVARKNPKTTVEAQDSATAQALLDELREGLGKSLPAKSTKRLPEVPLASQTPAQMDVPGWFVIRCIFERPSCLPSPDPVVSEPTETFQMAGFFDPDAPARPLKIALPGDITPAGLRKFDKNTAFMVSDMLCGQVKRARSLGLGDLIRSVLPWPLHKDLDVSTGGCKDDLGMSIGMMCSLSIPIITICAFILLMIIVNLLDLIFRWIAFFVMCFPIPKFSAKES